MALALARNDKEAHPQPLEQQLATEGVMGYKYLTPQNLAVTDPVETGSTGFTNRCHRNSNQLVVETADTKAVPPVPQNRFHRICSGKPKKCVCVAFVSLKNSHGLLEH